MLKIFKLFKSHENLQANMSVGLKLKSGMDRLSIILGIIFYGIHLLACAWIWIGVEGRNTQNIANNGWMDNEIYDGGRL
jgi:hypothetical protein